jgi:hypothetical protein
MAGTGGASGGCGASNIAQKQAFGAVARSGGADITHVHRTGVGGDLTGDDHRGGIRRGGLGVRAQVNAHARGQRGDEQMGGCAFENGFHGKKTPEKWLDGLTHRFVPNSYISMGVNSISLISIFYLSDEFFCTKSTLFLIFL